MGTIEKNRLCSVCGFDFFKDTGLKPWDNGSPSDEICASCGFQFGFDDYDDESGYGIKDKKYKEWRKKWIRDGMKWSTQKEYKPKDWNPREQLKNIPKEFLGPDEKY